MQITHFDRSGPTAGGGSWSAPAEGFRVAFGQKPRGRLEESIPDLLKQSHLLSIYVGYGYRIPVREAGRAESVWLVSH